MKTFTACSNARKAAAEAGLRTSGLGTGGGGGGGKICRREGLGLVMTTWGLVDCAIETGFSIGGLAETVAATKSFFFSGLTTSLRAGAGLTDWGFGLVSFGFEAGELARGADFPFLLAAAFFAIGLADFGAGFFVETLATPARVLFFAGKLFPGFALADFPTLALTGFAAAFGTFAVDLGLAFFVLAAIFSSFR